MSPKTSIDAFKERLILKLKEQPYPLFSFSDTLLPAASLWAGLRMWTHFFRQLELQKGDRIALYANESPLFLYVSLAALWEEITLILLPKNEQPQAAAQQLDARLLILPKQTNSPTEAWIAQADTHGMPPEKAPQCRITQRKSHSDAALILRSSGSSGNARWSQLSLRGLLTVVDSHLPKLALSEEARVLSILPWSHCFGFVLDLLPALFSKAEVHRRADYGKNTQALIDQINELQPVHLNAVPWHFEQLRKQTDQKFLNYLNGGIVGGAPIDQKVADFLQGSRIRVGYGQTEASPGISLGKVGQFKSGILGYPLGCDIKIGPNQELFFRGPNRFLGYFATGESSSTNTANTPQDWQPTGDIVRQDEEGCLYFLGRKDDRIKLPNGREIHPAAMEEYYLRHWPALEAVCLIPTAEGHLHGFWASTDPAFDWPSIFQGTESILAHYVHNWHRLAPEDWPYRPKGDTDRQRIKAFLPPYHG